MLSQKKSRSNQQMTVELASYFKNKNSNKIPQQQTEQRTLADIPQKSSEKILNILGQDYTKSTLFQKAKKHNLFLEHSLIYIDPMSQWTSFWNFIIIFTAYFLEFQISLTLAFGPTFWSSQISETKFFVTYLCLISLLFVDVLVNFNKGYYGFGKGKIIDDKRLIIRKYLSYHFIIDLGTLMILTIPLIYSNFYLNFIQIIAIILLTIKKFKCQAEITGSLKYNRTLRNLFILFMLGCDVLLLGNFGACIFVGIDLILWDIRYYGNDPAYYWLSNNSSFSYDLMDGPWDLQYVFAQSFSTGTLSTLAPGPFGKNPIQIFYAINVMIFFVLLASYAGEVVVQVMYSYEEVRIFHETNIQKFDQFMTLKGVSEPIRQKVQNFFQLIWEVQIKMDVQRQKQTLDKFPFTLKEQLLYEMGFCRYLRVFSNFSQRKILERQISMKILSEVIDEGTLILETNALIPLQKRFIVYLKSGLSKLYFKNKKSEDIIALSNVQKTVGQFQFITGLSYSYCCKAIDLCVVQKIPYLNFIQLLNNHDLMQEYFILKYQLLIQQKVNLISKICIVCEGQHVQNKCPQINIGNQIRQQLKKSEGFFKVHRKKASRKDIKAEKVTANNFQIKVKPKDELPSIFARFQVLGKILTSIGKNQQGIEQLQNFAKYFPEYNIAKTTT